VHELVSLVDLPPTLLDAAGLDVPAEMQGNSIMPLLRGRGDGAWPSEIFIQISESHLGRALRTRRWKYAVTAPDIDGNSAAWADSYVESHLYDLEVDPHELRNLVTSSAHQAVCERLRGRLVARMVEAGEKAPTILPATTARIAQMSVTEIEIAS
jgi:arylsulfatase A-like enzyme